MINRLALWLLVLVAAIAADTGRADDFAKRVEFPAADPKTVGVNPVALEKLAGVVQGYVDASETVGAELAVIKDGKMVLRRGFGLRDLTDKKPMETGGIYCIRSKSKTFIGTAVQMLIDDGKFKLEDKAAKYLPAFDREDKRDITIEHLLTHRSGLPLSSLLANPLDKVKSVQDVAGFAANAVLAFEPGNGFNYSDDGTDTLTAIIEQASGMTADEFITRRILQPLGLRDTMCVVDKDDPRTQRINSNHMGSKGSWMRYWHPGNDPIFKCLLGSQSIYSSIDDYAAFLAFWKSGGTADGKRLLSHEALKRAHTPASKMDYPSGFSGLSVAYGQMWMLYIPENPADLAQAKPVIFGHGGSDGTMAWVWPDRDLMVFYFTQSRGGMTVLSIESEIDRLLIRGDLTDRPTSQPSFGDLLGIYWNAEKGRYRALIEHDGKLTLEVPGAFAVVLLPTDKPDEWKPELEPTSRIKFERGADGRVTAMLGIVASGKTDRMPAYQPPADLPTLDDVVQKVTAAHGIGRIAGSVLRSGEVDLGARGKGRMSTLISCDKARVDVEVSGQATRTIADGQKVWMRQGDDAGSDLTGSMLEQTLMEQPQFIFGDWRLVCNDVRILARVERDGKQLLLIRAAPSTSFPCVIYVDEQTHRVVGQERIVLAPGLGPLGVTSLYDDFAELGGAVLPKRVTAKYRTPLLGTTVVTFDKSEVHAKLDPAQFSHDAP